MTKPQDKRSLADLLAPCTVPQALRPPPMTPLEAQLLELALIARKGSDGAGEPLPMLQRGFVYPPMVGARCETRCNARAIS